MVFTRKAKGVKLVVKRFQQAKRMKQAKRPTKTKRFKQSGRKIHIDSLPEELLQMVFDRLNLESVKAAALTCRKWNDIIFAGGYTNRFTFNINLVVPIPESISCYKFTIHWEKKLLELQELRKTHAERTLRAIAETQRSYSKLRCKTNDTMCVHNQSVLAAISKKFANELHTLELCFDNATMANMLPWIVETIPQMPQLETLKLEANDRNTQHQDTIPTLRSQTLKHLVMNTHFKVWLDLPQLLSFDGSLLVLDRPEGSLEPLAVPNLKHLTISVNETDDEFKMVVTREPSIIRSLPPIESMILTLGIENDEMFLATCESCTTLTDLKFCSSLWLSNNGVFSNLEKLTNLRKLSINSPSTSDESPLHFDFSPLTNLEKLEIVDSGVDSLIVPKSVKSLELVIDQQNERSMKKTIIKCSKQLIELGLFYVSWDHSAQDMPTELLKALPLLKNLEVLEFFGGFFKKSTFLCLESPMEKVRTLKFDKDNVDTRRFLGLKEKFPNLKEVIMNTDGSKRAQKSTNPDLYSAPIADIKESPSYAGYSDSDLDSFYSEDELSFDSDEDSFSDLESYY